MPTSSRINKIYLNGVWAIQAQTFAAEVLASGDGQPDQVAFFPRAPILPGEQIEVRELEGATVSTAWPMLEEELRQQGLVDSDFRLVNDRRTGQLSEVWVRWSSRPHFFFSGPEDRHYVIDRTRGRVIFGDGCHGRVPPLGKDNIRASSYRSGGGQAGNVAQGTINHLLSGVLSSGVVNPVAAGGGAEMETTEAVRTRGTALIHHRLQAITVADYQNLAREASPAVAMARSYHEERIGFDPKLPPPDRVVHVVIVPLSSDPAPIPSPELCREVKTFIQSRMPAATKEMITVEPPSYLRVGVSAVIALKEESEGSATLECCRQALADFLHPLRGGPQGTGWAFGRNVHLSDIASVLGTVSGIDFVDQLKLLDSNGIKLQDPNGKDAEEVEIPTDQLVAAGVITLSLAGKES